MLIGILEFFSGLLIVGIVLFDVFQSVVVPRWTARPFRFAPYLVDELWPRWKKMAFRWRDHDKREDVLGTFAPLVLIILLMVWVLALVFGYGLMLHALRGQTNHPEMGFPDSLYLAGVGLLTIGFGDIVAVEPLARMVLLSSAASGLAVFALVISLTFTLYGSFQRREVMVLTLDARAGAPPSGVTLLETYARFDLHDEMPEFFGSWERWAAEMLESHLAYPLLPYFRSSHDNESWIAAMGAVLDAATLIMTTVEGGGGHSERRSRKSQGAAHLMYGLGCHATIDLSHWFRFRLPGADAESGDIEPDAGVERLEFELARRRLEKAGYALLPFEDSWRDFRQKRAVYAAALNALARHFASPPSQWIGDRSAISHLHHRAPEEKTEAKTELEGGEVSPPLPESTPEETGEATHEDKPCSAA